MNNNQHYALIRINVPESLDIPLYRFVYLEEGMDEAGGHEVLKRFVNRTMFTDDALLALYPPATAVGDLHIYEGEAVSFRFHDDRYRYLDLLAGEDVSFDTIDEGSNDIQGSLDDGLQGH